jgi:hypothetical protein
MKDTKKEILKRINTATAFYVWCVMDGRDDGQYFKTTKSEVLHWTKLYLKGNTDLENLDNCFRLRECGALFIN